MFQNNYKIDAASSETKTSLIPLPSFSDTTLSQVLSPLKHAGGPAGHQSWQGARIVLSES